MIFGIVFTNGCKSSIKKCVQKGLKKYNYIIYMDMNKDIVTLPKKGLKDKTI